MSDDLWQPISTTEQLEGSNQCCFFMNDLPEQQIINKETCVLVALLDTKPTSKTVQDANQLS